MLSAVTSPWAPLTMRPPTRVAETSPCCTSSVALPSTSSMVHVAVAVRQLEIALDADRVHVAVPAWMSAGPATRSTRTLS